MADTSPTSTPKINFEEPAIGDQTVEQYAANQVQTPELPPGTEQVSVDIEPQDNEFVDPSVTDVTSPTGEATTAETSVVADSDIADILDVTPEDMEAYAATGVEGTVTPESTMRHQMEQLMGDVEAGDAPWADAAMRKADQLMFKRGLGASTMAGAAISQAVLEAAMPIAQFDANTFGTMNLQNVRNQQEAMLSTQAAENAARQFNAQNANEINKFMAEMRDRVYRFNSEQMNQMNRFNADQDNSMNMFYDKMQNETDKFIAENKTLVARSNVEWRRAINTANTAAENAVLQQNIQNRFNMSQQALADLWQRSRDIFDWANKTAENAKDRAYNITMYTMKRDDFLQDVEAEQKNQFWEGVGTLAADIIGDASKSIIDNWLGE